MGANEYGKDQRAKEFATAADGPSRSPSTAAVSQNLGSLDVFERRALNVDRPRAELISPEARARGVDVSGARRLLDDGKQQAYALPVKDGVCLTGSSHIVDMCLPDLALPTTAGAEGLNGFQVAVCSPYLDADRLALFGIVPNGMNDLRFVRTDGSSEPIATDANFVFFSVAKSEPLPVTATWQDTSGTSFSGELPMPRDASKSDCDTPQTPAEARAEADAEALAATAG